LICGHRLLRQQQAGTLVEIGAARPQDFSSGAVKIEVKQTYR